LLNRCGLLYFLNPSDFTLQPPSQPLQHREWAGPLERAGPENIVTNA
jgi:hypothetical protein